jgi:hypothetical protein
MKLPLPAHLPVRTKLMPPGRAAELSSTAVADSPCEPSSVPDVSESISSFVPLLF